MNERTEDTWALTKDRKERILSAIDAGGRGTHARLARYLEINSGQLTELLGPQSKYSQYVGQIYDFFGWQLPIEEAVTAQPPAPKLSPLAETVRRNMLAFREECRLDQFAAADAAGIPYEDLKAYELGEVAVPIEARLEFFAAAYRRPAEQFLMQAPPPRSSPPPNLWWRATPEVRERMSPEDVAELDAIMKRMGDRYAEKKAVTKHVQAAKTRRQKQ